MAGKQIAIGKTQAAKFISWWTKITALKTVADQERKAKRALH